MKKQMKTIATFLLVFLLLTEVRANVYAVTPQYRPIHFDLNFDDIVDAVEDYLKDHPVQIKDLKVKAPEITQSIYYHKKLYFNKARLQVRWNECKDAKYYEINATKKNGEKKIYKTTYNSLFINEKSDSFVISCLRSGKVKVRVTTTKGKTSNWSNEKTIFCNSLHRVNVK